LFLKKLGGFDPHNPPPPWKKDFRNDQKALGIAVFLDIRRSNLESIASMKKGIYLHGYPWIYPLKIPIICKKKPLTFSTQQFAQWNTA